MADGQYSFETRLARVEQRVTDMRERVEDVAALIPEAAKLGVRLDAVNASLDTYNRRMDKYDRERDQDNRDANTKKHVQRIADKNTRTIMVGSSLAMLTGLVTTILNILSSHGIH